MPAKYNRNRQNTVKMQAKGCTNAGLNLEKMQTKCCKYADKMPAKYNQNGSVTLSKCSQKYGKHAKVLKTPKSFTPLNYWIWMTV